MASFFAFADEDKDDKLSWKEFKAVWRRAWPDWSPDMLIEVFKNADFNEDGQITMEEALDEKREQEKIEKKFKIMDTDKLFCFH